MIELLQFLQYSKMAKEKLQLMLYAGPSCITQQYLAIRRTAYGRIVNIMAISVWAMNLKLMKVISVKLNKWEDRN